MDADLVTRIAGHPKYQELKAKRTAFGWWLTLAMMVAYFGFILLVAFNKPFLSQRLGEGVMTMGIPIHGIRPEMVADAPTIDRILPAFHAFAADTVLVAHNAAFDMRFLQLQEQATGVVFEQPVLDTLLLSALVHPQQDSHGLEAIAERLGVAMLGRHTALGDAIVTAEIFLKLLPLLAERGILTLGQARQAAQKTYYARISY